MSNFVEPQGPSTIFSFKIDATGRAALCCATMIACDRKEIVMNTGTVKFFNSTKGFGFIQPDNGGTDVFVHISAVERAGMRTIVEGQKLSFEVVPDKRSGKSAAENLQAA
jgi:CspA family cold shock protein